MNHLQIFRRKLFYAANSWQRIYLIFLFVFSTILSLSQFPIISKDSQYYLQSAILWPLGKVSFAASWIGERSFAVWIYHLFFQLFGNTLDAVVLSLVLIRLITFFGFYLFTFSILKKPTSRNIVFSLIVLLVSFSEIFLIPATENICLMLLSIAIGCLALASENKDLNILKYLSVFLMGIAFSIRSEILLLPIIFLFFYFLDKRKFEVKLFLPTLFLFAGGFQFHTALWQTWVPKEKPQSYRAAIGMFRPFYIYGFGKNGKNSQRLGAILKTPPSEKIPYWKSVGLTYKLLGPKESNRLVSMVGFEAIIKNWEKLIKISSQDFISAMKNTGKFTFELKKTKTLKLELLSDLERFDDARIQASSLFGSDFTYRTADLVRQPQKHTRFTPIPEISILANIRLPGLFLFICLFLSILTSAILSKWIYLTIPVYGLSVSIISTILQGANYRYFSIALILSFVWSLILICKLLRIRSRKSI